MTKHPHLGQTFAVFRPALIGVLATIATCSAGRTGSARADAGTTWVTADLSTADSLGNPVKLQFRNVIPFGWSEGTHPLGTNTHWYTVQGVDSTQTTALTFTAALVVRGKVVADTTYWRSPIHLNALLRDVRRTYWPTPAWTVFDDTLVSGVRATPGAPFSLVVSFDFDSGAVGEAEVQLLFAGLPPGARVVRAAPPRREMGCRIKSLYR